jgi:hypothetical protein
MKTIRIILSAFIALCCLSVYSYGQSTSTKATEPMYLGYECDGVFDVLQGEIAWHNITHFDKDGIWKWNKWQAHSNGMVSMNTGEVFNLSNKTNNGFDNKQMNLFNQTQHYNLVGDMGTHLIYSVTWEWDMNADIWTKVDEKVKCK